MKSSTVRIAVIGEHVAPCVTVVIARPGTWLFAGPHVVLQSGPSIQEIESHLRFDPTHVIVSSAIGSSILLTCSDDLRWLVLIRCSGDFMSYLPSYAAALRCIGQAVQSQNIEVFELKSHADEFRLQCGDPNPPYTALIEMAFSKEKIQMIDREGRRRRGQSTGEIRFDGIPEILRAVGQYIDKKGGYLRLINNSGSSSDTALELEYQTRAGQVEMETLAMSFIREACVRMYQRRTGLNDPVNLLTRKR